MSSAEPTLRATSIQEGDGSSASLVEVVVPAPEAAALAVVFDLSDSCVTMIREVEKLKKLLEPLPRQWEIWSFALSRLTPLYACGEHTLAHLQDGSLAPADLLTDRLRRAQVSCGSFVGPVLQSIERERAARRIGHVSVLVVTDGELSDAFALDVPEKIHLVGLTGQEQSFVPEWNRALPGRSLYTLSDPLLLQELRTNVQPFYANCKIAVEAPTAATFEVQHWNSATHTLRTWDNHFGAWNFIDGPLRLIFNATLAEMSDVRLRCVVSKTEQSLVLPIASAAGEIDPTVAAHAQTHYARHGTADSTVVLDMSFSDGRFTEVWKSVVAAANLTAAKKPWSDGNGRLSLPESEFTQVVLNGGGQPKYDALLCLVSGEVTPTPPESARVVLIGLHRQSSPALHWKSGASLSFATPSADMVVEYERMQSRWYARIGDRSSPREELNPRGSQKITCPLPTSSGDWVAFFSGDLGKR